MLAISPLATIAVLVPLVAIRVASALVQRRLEVTRRASRVATGQVTGFIGEVFGAALAVKVNTAERQVVEHFRGLGEGRRRAELQNMLLNQLVRRSWSLTDSLATGLILLLVGASLQDGTFTVGDFALFVSYIGVIGDALDWIGGTLVDATQAKVSWQRLVELLQGDAPPPALVEHGPVYMRGAFPSIPHIAKTTAHRLDTLDADGLTYRHPDSGRGITGVNLYLPRGSFTVITGRIGFGKCTLLRALLGLPPVMRGSYAGMASRLTTRPHSSYRRGWPTRHRCRGCSARPCATTSSWACHRPRWTSRPLSAQRSWNATWRN